MPEFGDVSTGSDVFSVSAQRIVDYLNAHTPLTDWSVSRVAGGEQVHVHVHPGAFINVGTRVPWPRTFCNRMMLGAARVVADSLADPDYADLPDAVAVRSYAGSPITDDDGTVFGTLCGVGSEPLGRADEVDTDLVQLMSELLSSQLAMARAADRGRRAAEIAEALAHTDLLTGLVNRRGWDLLVNDAQQRVDSYGDLVAIGVIDLDGLKTVNDTEGHQAGDGCWPGQVRHCRPSSLPINRIARYGGDEFAILANNIAVADLAEHFGRFVDSLAEHGIQASLGYAPTGPDRTLVDAFAAADAEMYTVKQVRKRG
ncbi:diguanylate cyclase [Aeromicrobium sp. UC242_57]|uniref:diguanylate cyclase n=1 Tax=Aeromicrobium sp. UC242_57 TaxID=3374624 RepID=UPI003787ECFC